MITIGFSRHKGFAPLSWLIMLCERTKFSHAYIKIKSESLNRTLIYQATGSGVYFIGEEAFKLSSEVVEEYPLEVSPEHRIKLLQWAVDNSGKPYGKMQLLGLGVIRLVKLFGLKINNPFSNGNKAYICCELVTEAIENIGLFPPTDLDKVDLRSIKAIVESWIK